VPTDLAAVARPRSIPSLLLLVAAAVGLIAAGGGKARGADPDWPQWGRTPGHGASAAGPAQPLGTILSDFVYDPFVPAATAEAHGNLLAHYPVPLLDGGDVYMETKTGTYVSCSPPGSGQPAPCGPDAWDRQIWNVQKLHWTSGALSPVWRFETDWKPEPNAGHLAGWEPVFHPALAGGFLWVPGSGGSVFRVRKDTGAGTRISPFGAAIDPSIYVAGGLAADAAGNVYYNAIQLDPAGPWSRDALGAWLVQVRPDGTFRRAAFADLTPGGPPALAQCERQFGGATPLPFPPSPDAAPPTGPCGSQRPGLNVVPAIGADGTVFTVSRAHFADRYAWLIAVDSSLTPRWAASLRDRLHDGCGVLLPPNGSPGGCRAGASLGVDPTTNRLPAGRVIDLGTSSPVALDDGSVLFGAYTSYNYSRGHLLKFDAQGGFTASYDFGWDITPAIRQHDGTFSVLLKDNHYETGSYCGDPAFCPAESGAYDIVSLDAGLRPEWTFRNANTESCARQPDGSVTCVSDHPDGFEWCINQPAVDGEGVVYANSEDGFLYAIAPDGTLRSKIFLNLALGAAYTPLSIGSDGILYTQNNGHLFAVGNPLRPDPIRPGRRARQPGPIRQATARSGH
jgi:hypothetical protein